MWKDITSYRYGDKEKTPTTYALKTTDVRVVVTCGHINCPGSWVMSAYPLGIDTRELEATTLEDAKAEAIRIVKEKVLRVLSDLDAISST
jgi:hypothetical protein